STADLDKQWATLAGSDASKAFQAIRRLAASPNLAVPYLKAHLSPAPSPNEKRIAQLVADLDSNQFDVPEAADIELQKLGELAIPAIKKSLADIASPEVRRRLEALVEKQQQESVTPTPERLRLLRAVEVLEWMATPEAKELLAGLAKGAPGA